jgi:hypothetical protein
MLPIDGLSMIHDFITPEQEEELMRHLDSMPWGGNGVEHT